MKAFIAALSLFATIACGGDSTAPEPEPAYPALSGTFNMQASFDQFPTSLANGNGTIVFVQADRDQPNVTATGNIIVVAGGTTGTMTAVRNVLLTTSGGISFQLGTSTTGTAAWGFDGTLSADGRTMTGRHTLAGSGSSFAGNWTATKQ